MPKKCIICETLASFAIKDCPEAYCDSCAREHFSDLELLQQLDSQAQVINALIENRMFGE